MSQVKPTGDEMFETLMLLKANSNSKWKSAQRDANTARPPQSPHRRTESAMAVVRQSQNSPPPAADPFPERRTAKI